MEEIGQLGNDGYVVNSVPLAIAAASIVSRIGIEEMYTQLIKIGGDTDTNCSIAGQITGALVGSQGIPEHLLEQLKGLSEYGWIEGVIGAYVNKEDWTI